MGTASIPRTSCQSARRTPSAPKPLRKIREWKSDAEYIKDQDETSSRSSTSAWGEAAAYKFVTFGRWLGDRLCHDDKVADFGGNDGYAAFCFYREHKIKPLVIDCEPKRIDYAGKVYHLPTYETFIESMSALADKSMDWGFTSHTLEHTRDTEMALREISRVVKRGCYFVLPLEKVSHGRHNHAHSICIATVKGWMRLLRQNGWKVVMSEKVGDHEAHIYAEPAC